ncbi:hypothetical protein ABT008_10615 [Micromonospora sp. NPDC002389]|uniref:hypothetical protein n=1 Tax=Micromonospora sp. NPDC002389 TaxID=3154272 RepID=UPI00331DE2BD
MSDDRRWPRWLIAVSLVGLGTLTGCGSDASGGQVVESDGVRTIVAPASDGGRDAQIAGELIVADGRCLAVRTNEGSVYLLAWPNGTTLLGDGQTGVKVPGKGDIKVGDSFEAGGGYQSPPLGDGFPDVPTECVGSEEVAVIDSIN